jgi:type VI secretion system protein ImpL
MMKKKALVVPMATLLGFVLLAVLLDWLLPLVGLDRALLWVGLLVLGLGTAVLLWLHFRAGTAGRGDTAALGDVDVPLADARRRLAAAGVARGRLSRLPLVLLLGSGGSTKTSSVVQSGLDPELIAGDAGSGAEVTPTATLNVWYAQGSVILEAGGKVLEDDRRWHRLLERIRPSRLAAAMGFGRQAPRAAVVCVSCEELLAPTGADAVMAMAMRLRGRLAEASRSLGVRLPVYVLFTKADRVSHFEEYVRGLTREEAQQLVGSSLPIEVTDGSYGETQPQRLRSAFRGIFRSLAEWRLHLLSREGREIDRTSAYEFPREILKISSLAEPFLVELFRPSQLGVNPILRGFYFTGVRPVTTTAAPERPGPAPQRIALGATSVFSLQSIQQAVTPERVPTGSTRIPDWVFLRRFYRDIVLRDTVAAALTGSGRRVDFFRRSMIGAAALLLVVLAGAMTVSFANNRAIAKESLAALQGLEPLRAGIGEPPSIEDLARLDAARAVLARLGEYERERRPLRVRWGLYSGGRIHPELRQAYFARFAPLVWSGAREDILTSLARVPDGPEETEAYGAAYEALKAHLVTTSHPEESTADFLTPLVMRHWQLAAVLDPEREDLVRRQIDFFGDELPHGNPYADRPNESIVLPVRAYLQRFTGTEPLYRALLTDAAQQAEPVQFHRAHPGSESVVRNSYTVPAAFTRDGWERVQAAFDDLDRLLAREDWVVGERAVVAAPDRTRLAEELRTRYVADYAAAWRDYLRAGEVVAFGGAADASRKLALLSGNESPLLQMLGLASRHTAVDTVVIGRAFQPIHLVVPPGEVGQVVSEANAGYLSALSMLQSAMEQVAQASGPARNDALAQASSNADQVNQQVRQLAQAFSVQGEAREVGLAVQRLLQAPIGGAESLARSLPAAQTNAQGAAFCAQVGQLAGRFPFNPTGAADASLDDVISVLQRGNSVLWSFYDDVLQTLLVPQGSRYAARVGADTQPTAAFVAFFNSAAEISAGLFPRENAGPQVVFAFRPETSDLIPEIRVTVDGQSQDFTRTVAAARTYTWDMERARTARITTVRGGSEVNLVVAPDGPWALFRLMHAAEWERTGNARYRLTWRIPVEPGTLSAELTFANPQPVLMPGFLQLNCVSQIVR